MTVKRSWLRRIGCTLPGVGLAAWLGWANWHVNAQDTGIPPNTTRSYLNKTTINLPIVVDERHRAQLQHVLLYVKEGATQPWKMCDKAAPTQTMFTYRAAGEGEYWFNIVSVDNMGRMTPADVTKEAPALIVVLDTQAPQVEVQPLEKAADGQYVRCDWHDTHLDTFKSRLYYQTGDMMWRPVDMHAKRANTFCIPGQANWTGNVRAVAVDLAGNAVTREKNLMAAGPAPAGFNASMPLISPTLVAQNSSAPVVQAPIIPSAPGAPPSNVVLPGTSGNPAPLPPPMFSSTTLPGTPDLVLPPMPPGKDTMALLNPPAPVVPPLPSRGTAEKTLPTEVTSQKITPALPQLFDPSVASKSMPLVGPHDLKQATFNARDPVSLPRQYSNTSRVFLDYRIEAMGASGVGKVEVWYTRDLGQSWQKLGEDSDRQSPAEINLPGDGIYGLTLVITNGRGFGGVAPAPGDSPDSWVEVDTTKPLGEIIQVRAGTGEDSGALHIAWHARDKNLGQDAVELEYAATREGPWHQVAKGLKNEGIYRWVPPAEAGAQVFLRLKVRDQANNVAFADTPQPVPLDDASRPRGRVLSISTAPPRPNPLPPVP